MDDVCNDVEIESLLQTLQGESVENKTTTRQEAARIDIKASGLWGPCFFSMHLQFESLQSISQSIKNPI